MEHRTACILFPQIPKVLIDWDLETVEVISAQWTVNQLVRVWGFVLRFTVLLKCGHKGTDTSSNSCYNVVSVQHVTRGPMCAKKNVLHIFGPASAQSNKARRILASQSNGTLLHVKPAKVFHLIFDTLPRLCILQIQLHDLKRYVLGRSVLLTLTLYFYLKQCTSPPLTPDNRQRTFSQKPAGYLGAVTSNLDSRGSSSNYKSDPWIKVITKDKSIYVLKGTFRLALHKFLSSLFLFPVILDIDAYLCFLFLVLLVPLIVLHL